MLDKDYEEIESIWETHFIHNLITPRDSRDITEALRKYGKGKTLDVMRKVYEKRQSVASFSYILKILETQASKPGNISGIEAFQTAEEKKMIKALRIEQYKRSKIRGYLRPGFPRRLFFDWIGNGKPLSVDPMPKRLQEEMVKWV